VYVLVIFKFNPLHANAVKMNAQVAQSDANASSDGIINSYCGCMHGTFLMVTPPEIEICILIGWDFISLLCCAEDLLGVKALQIALICMGLLIY
jgi:hypothetical protein